MTKLRSISLLLVAAACKSDPGAAAQQDPKATEIGSQLAGVWPTQFQCASIATPDALAQIFGATPTQVDNPMSMPKGVAPPCMYELSRDGALEQWQFDFDCRDSMKTTADALFEQYKKQNSEMIADWNQKADAGVFKPNDAGVEYHRPGDPLEVPVGAKGLDHHGVALIFIDDDAPCYVRVAGKDAARRLELAKLIAKNLTYVNAPMSPRPRK